MVDAAKLKEAVFAVIDEHGLDNLTQKKVQRHAEEKLGLEEKELKGHKEEVNKLIDEYIEAHPQGEDDAEEEPPKAKEAPKRKAAAKKEPVEEDEDDDFDDEEEEEAPKAKKPKKEAPAEKAEKTFRVETASGDECPKKIKDLQKKIISRSDFVKSAPAMNIELWGNNLEGKPREFSSGNMGWYTGGKVEFKVKGKKMWGQLGINLTVMGSKDWKK